MRYYAAMDVPFVDRLREALGVRPGEDGASAPKPAEPSLTESLLVEAIDDPILCIDSRRRVRLANNAARRLLGAHVEGEDVRVAIRHPAAAIAISGGQAQEERVELTGLSTADDRWELRVAPIEGGAMIRLIDRSATRDAERMRTDFVANASHELRTPLATLLGFIETMEGPAAADATVRARFLTIMRQEAERMTRLVDDLMSLSRIEADKHRPPVETVTLRAATDEVVGTLAQKLADAGRRLEVEQPADFQPTVAGQRDQLVQLLHNLIGNAIKYSRPESTIRVGISPAERNMVRLTVADEGDGIAPEHLPRLTERFYRIDAGRSRAMGGTGLGLAIVKHIVERHRGQLNIASQLGVGTTVTVLLPAVETTSEPA
jgi:two-component system phosphate regulon sensor histidine kinase PhoR